MAEITYADTYTAKPGDVIVDGGNRIYVENVRVLDRSNSHSDTEWVQFERELTVVEYRRSFYLKDDPISKGGYSFPCDAEGNVVDDTYGWVNRIEELKNNPDYIDEGITVYRRSFRDPAIIKCKGTQSFVNNRTGDARYEPCNNEVTLNMVMTNTCEKCGADYSVSGQRLAPRSQWGWDTGESVSDILASDWNINDPIPGRDYYEED